MLAVERDRDTLRRLQHAVERERLGDRIQLRRADLRQLPWPRGPYRVVANPPFALTSALLGRLFDDLGRGPTRADLLLQWGVVQRRTGWLVAERRDPPIPPAELAPAFRDAIGPTWQRLRG